MATTDNYQQPTCEDGSDSDDGRVFVESFAGRKSPNANAANVSTKRSHPSDLDKEKAPAKGRPSNHSDLRSDSGYSSYTAATVSSADSGPRVYSHPPPPPPETSRADPPTTSSLPQSPPQQKPRRPTVSERKSSSASASASANGSTNTSTSSAARPQAPSRTASQSSKRPPGVQRRPTITQNRRDSRVQSDCTDPNCTKCVFPTAPPRARPELGPSQSARDVRPQHIPPDQRSMHSDPADYYATPPSPSYTRQPMYNRGPAVVQPAPPRRRASSTSRQRPQSYSGDPGAQYWASGVAPPYPSPPQERGPPPSASAMYRNMPQYQQMPPPMAPYGMPPQPGYYPPQYQTSPPYDMPQRPDMPSRGSYYGTRPQAPPVITQQDRREPQPGYSARYPPQGAIQGKAPLQLEDRSYESSESDYSSEEEEYERNPRQALVPTQKLKRTKSQGKQQRPNLRHAATTQGLPERPRERERVGRTSNASTTRRPSVSRPRPPQREIHSAYDTPTARVIVNDSRDRRRQSTQVYDKMYDQYAKAVAKQERLAEAQALLEKQAFEEKYARAKAREEKLKAQALEEQFARAKAREEELAKHQAMEEQIARTQALEAQLREQRRQRRNSKVYRVPEVFDDDETEEDDYEEEEEYQVQRSRPVIVRDGRRRPTDGASRKGKERTAEPKNKQSAAEDYISAKRGNAVPLVEQVHKAAKRGSRLPSAPSRSGSSGSDEQSQSARTDEVRLRVDNNAPISLQLKGDMGDRMLRLIPGENGTTDIVIANPNGGESVYSKSERGSVVGRNRRSMVGGQPRREAEEYTERSSHSNRSRRENREDREPQRHVLRRYRT